MSAFNLSKSSHIICTNPFSTSLYMSVDQWTFRPTEHVRYITQVIHSAQTTKYKGDPKSWKRSKLQKSFCSAVMWLVRVWSASTHSVSLQGRAASLPLCSSGLCNLWHIYCLTSEVTQNHSGPRWSRFLLPLIVSTHWTFWLGCCDMQSRCFDICPTVNIHALSAPPCVAVFSQHNGDVTQGHVEGCGPLLSPLADKNSPFPSTTVKCTLVGASCMWW